MRITEQLRERLQNYMDAEQRSVRYVAGKVEIVSYQSIQNFLKGKHRSTGKVIDKIDAFLRSEGY